MVTLATGPSGPSRASRIGQAIGAGFGQGFVPSFQRTREDLQIQERFNPIREALKANLTGGVTSPGQQLIQQITADPNIFAQVMQKPELAELILSLNRAGRPVTGRALTGFSKVDETNAFFDQAIAAESRGEKKRAQALFAKAGVKTDVGGSDLVHVVRRGTTEPIPVLLGKDDKLRDFDGNAITLQEGDRLLETVGASGTLEGVLGTSEREKLRDAEVATKNFIATADDALRLLQEEPGVNTLTGRAVALFGDLKAEATQIAKIFGMTFDESQLNPETYNEQFTRLGVNSARMRSLITSMGFQAAAAAGQRSQGVSNRDIERFIEQVGGNSGNPVAFAAVLRDEAERTARNFRNNFFVRTQKEFEGDLGLGGLVTPSVTTPSVEEIQNLSNDQLFVF